MQPLQCAAGVVESALGAVAELGRCIVGGADLQNAADVDAPLGNLGTQSPAGVSLASPGYAMGCSKVRCRLCSV